MGIRWELNFTAHVNFDTPARSIKLMCATHYTLFWPAVLERYGQYCLWLVSEMPHIANEIDEKEYLILSRLIPHGNGLERGIRIVLSWTLSGADEMP